MESVASEKVHFNDYLRPILQRKWLILVAVIAATGGVYAFYAQKPKEYTAGTLVFTQEPGDPVSGTGVLPSTDRSVQNRAALLYSQGVATAVKKRIGYSGTPSQLLTSVRIDARTGQDIVEISARAASPTLVADIANGYAKEFVARSNGEQRDRVKAAANLARKQLASVPVRTDTRATREELAERIRALDLALSVPPATTRQVDEAAPPTKAAAPKPGRNAIFAFVLSLVLAVSLAFGLERFDRRIKRPEEARDAYGLPLLAMVPHSDNPTPHEDGLVALGPDLREAFRTLRTNIDLTHLDQPPRTILVTSGIRGEGKSTVVRNLALAFCETGKRVAVVECDLRRPSLAGMFGQEQGAGFSEVLSGEERLEDVALRVRTKVSGMKDLVRMKDASTLASDNGASPSQDDSTVAITLLLSGACPANPPTVLVSGRARDVLDEVASSHDVTIIDSAPLLSVTDSVPLLRYADSVIVVGRLGYTTRDTAERLSELVERVPDANPIGILANDLTRLEAMGYGYGQGYGYGYEETPQKSKKVADKKHSGQAV